jgi:drug/metabolite transporter (DMT)-like permease
MFRLSPHIAAVLQALLVTFLWSTSWVFIKIGLQDAIPPLTFAGLRYTLAFFCLLLIVLQRPALRQSIRQLPRKSWGVLLVLGLLFYSVNQGAQFVGLALLPAATVNLLLSFAGVLVAVLSTFLLSENPTRLQWAGMSIYGVGVVIYFFPVALDANQFVGMLVVVAGVLANVGASIIGRRLNREHVLQPIVITVVSMGFGSIILLFTGIVTQGFPPLTLVQWGIIGWLALVNTAFAFTLWNHTLRTLSATESSIINNAMLIQIPILAWVFLGETVTARQGLSIIIAGVGIVLVQLRQLRLKSVTKEGVV